MKAILLAAGEGRRLRPLTDTIPKCLVPIGGTPLLSIWFQLLEDAGIREVLLNLHHGRERVDEFLSRCSTPIGVTTSYESELLGTAGTVIANRTFVEGEDRFLVVYADNLTSFDVGQLVHFHDSRNECLTMAVMTTDRPSEKGTVVVDATGRIVAFEEKAVHPRSTLANAGLYVTSSKIFKRFPAWRPGDGVLDFGYHVLPQLVGDMAAYRIDDFVMDIGTPESYERAQSIWAGLSRAARRPHTAEKKPTASDRTISSPARRHA